MQKFTFKKEERLCSEKLLGLLYKNGSSFLLYPYRFTWMFNPHEQAYPVQVVVGVPKKRFKRSVDRNLLKRRIKECYRLQKQELLYQPLESRGQYLLLGVNYVGKEILEHDHLCARLQKAMALLLTKLGESK